MLSESMRKHILTDTAAIFWNFCMGSLALTGKKFIDNCAHIFLRKINRVQAVFPFVGNGNLIDIFKVF